MTALHGSGPFFAGSALTLRCAVEVDAAVDIPYTVTVVWLKSGESIGSNDHTTVSNVMQLSSYTYETTLNLNPLSSTSDTGTYTCQAAVNPTSPSPLVQGHTQADLLTIIIQGNFIVQNRGMACTSNLYTPPKAFMKCLTNFFLSGSKSAKHNYSQILFWWWPSAQLLRQCWTFPI